MMHGIRPEVVAANAEVAAWLIKGYEPGPGRRRRHRQRQGRRPPYPMLPYMGLLHTALGNELGEFMQGQEDADQGAGRRRRGLQHRRAGKAASSTEPRRRAPAPARRPAAPSASRAPFPTPPGAPDAAPDLLRLHPAVARRDAAVHRAADRLGRRAVALRRARAGAGRGRELRPLRLHHRDPRRHRGDGRSCATEQPMGRFNGLGTYTNRSHLAFAEVGAIWREQHRHRRRRSRAICNLPFYKALVFTLVYTLRRHAAGHRPRLRHRAGGQRRPAAAQGAGDLLLAAADDHHAAGRLADPVLDDRRRRHHRRDAAGPVQRPDAVAARPRRR